MKTLSIKVKPRSRESGLTEGSDGQWVARLKAPPIDGKANQELIKLVAKKFGCRPGAVSISSGASGRLKLVKIPGEGPHGS